MEPTISCDTCEDTGWTWAEERCTGADSGPTQYSVPCEECDRGQRVAEYLRDERRFGPYVD